MPVVEAIVAKTIRDDQSCITGKTTGSKASAKHCDYGTCGRKLISGANWSKHMNDQHPEVQKHEIVVIKCTGIDCELCLNCKCPSHAHTSYFDI